jgi:BASS family bile acid:Na+ symporter
MQRDAVHAILMTLSALYLGAMMLALGLELGGGPKESKGEKRVKHRALAVGLLFNLVLLPLVTVGVARALHASGAVIVALLLLAAAPGGRWAPHAVKVGKGDVALSAEVTIFLAKITCITAVPMAKWLLTLRSLEIHELPFVLQLFFLQILPFYFGKWLRGKRPEAGARIRRVAEATAIATAVAVLAVALVRTEKWFELFDTRSWLAVACVGVVSPVLGWLVGGRRPGHRRALAIGADARELSLALVMASFAFPTAEVRTALFAVALIFILATFLLAWVLRTLGRRRPRAAGAQGGAPAPRPASA